MKAKLLKTIRDNTYVTRAEGGFTISVSSFWLNGSFIKTIISKEDLRESIRTLTIHVARNNFKRKGVRL